MNEEGPVREQIFEERQKLRNLQDFMTKEGYENHEVDDAGKDGLARKHNLMLKSIRRI